ncbi:MAG: pyridoxal-phosphate dependent enzyme, partial [Leadbetterella sp.]
MDSIDFSLHLRIPSQIQPWSSSLFDQRRVAVLIKREDLIHPEISGNKFRKLKYALLEAKQLGKTRLVTFGGAYSNHVLALASAGNMFGFETQAYIRGEELNSSSNATLFRANELGMKLHFVTRNEYQYKNKLVENLDDQSYIISEGGSDPICMQ